MQQVVVVEGLGAADGGVGVEKGIDVVLRLILLSNYGAVVGWRTFDDPAWRDLVEVEAVVVLVVEAESVVDSVARNVQRVLLVIDARPVEVVQLPGRLHLGEFLVRRRRLLVAQPVSDLLLPLLAPRPRLGLGRCAHQPRDR